jgi:archaellum component FlaD/FlaE
MNVNPEDYDPEELRQMAEERRESDAPGGRTRMPAEQASSGASSGHPPRRNGIGGHGEEGRWSFGDERSAPRSSQAGQGGGRGEPAEQRETEPDGDNRRAGGAEPTARRGNPHFDRRDRGHERGNPPTRRGVAADALRSNQLEQLFLHQSAMVGEQMTKPYLGDIPQKYAAERVIFDWLEFLVFKGGFKRAMDALRYYRTIDWITADVEASLQDYLVGFSDEGAGRSELDVDDHQLSLLYVARLASMN